MPFTGLQIFTNHIIVLFFQVIHCKTLISEAVLTGEQEPLFPEVEVGFETLSASEEHLQAGKLPFHCIK